MAQPLTFLAFPHKRPTLAEWVGAWIDHHYQRRTNLPRREVLDGLFEDMPRAYLPTDLRVLQRNWFMKRMGDTVARSLGLAYTDGQGGSRWDAQLALPFDEFLAYEVGKLRLAQRDVERVRHDVEEYRDANGYLDIDVDATVARIKQAAGL
jgi:hypothetical protein